MNLSPLKVYLSKSPVAGAPFVVLNPQGQVVRWVVYRSSALGRFSRRAARLGYRVTWDY